MNDSENKKTPEELADEAVDAVAGGAPRFFSPDELIRRETDAMLAGQEVESQRKR